MLALHEAMEKMRTLDDRMSRVVELRLFGGLTGDETARVMDISPRTVDREWKAGQAWLRRKLSTGAPE